MKKRCVSLLIGAVAGCSAPLAAQIPVSPSDWDAFVRSSENKLMVDTFRLQDFEGRRADNWLYTLAGGADVFDAGAAGLSGQSGANSLRIPLGGLLEMTPITLRGYQNVAMEAWYAISGVVAGENLNVRFTNQSSGDKEMVLLPVTSEAPVFCNYGVRYVYGKGSSEAVTNPVRIKGNPTRLAFEAAAPASGTQGGFYGIDRLMAIGEIEQYTLFSGAGGWSDTARWSHLPAARRRKALVAGTAGVTEPESCGNLAIGAGRVEVGEDGCLDIKNRLLLYASEEGAGSLVNRGVVRVASRTIVRKEFPEKGKWYFISFPFDVYASGISGWTLKGGEPNGGGDFFYVKTYDGRQRAASGLETDNWTTRWPVADSEPVFEQYKGYLIALDAGASSRQLDFSSAEGAVPETFGKSASLPVPCYLHGSDPDSEHSGWFLCGNPFPAPLSLRMLGETPGIGRYVYWYDGDTYRVYETGSDQEIPPYGAFFLKVTADCTLDIDRTSVPVSRSDPGGAPVDAMLQLSDGSRSDRIVFRCFPSGTEAGEPVPPAYKWYSFDRSMPQLASRMSGRASGLAVHPLRADGEAVPLSLRLGKDGRYTFSLTGAAEASGLSVSLIDRLSGDTLLLSGDNRSYAFRGAAGACDDRFAVWVRSSDSISAPSSELPGMRVCFTDKNRLLVTGLPRAGYACVLDERGGVRQRIALPAGDSTAFITVSPGTYTIVVRSGPCETVIDAAVGR